MSDFLDKRDRRTLRRLFVGAVALSIDVMELARREMNVFDESLTRSQDPM